MARLSLCTTATMIGMTATTATGDTGGAPVPPTACAVPAARPLTGEGAPAPTPTAGGLPAHASTAAGASALTRADA